MNFELASDMSDGIEMPVATDPIYKGEIASLMDSVPLYGDDFWSVRFFSANPSTPNNVINWTTYPLVFREHLRLAAWGLFNLPFPDDYRRAYAPTMRSTLSAGLIYRTANDWRMLGRWLDKRGVDSLNDLNGTLMTDYATYVREERRVSRNRVVHQLIAITRLWVIGQQIPDLRLGGTPPWLIGSMDEHLPLENRASGDNMTEPISTETMAALLDWSMRTIDTCTEPIQAAQRFVQKLHLTTDAEEFKKGREGTACLNEYFEELKACNKPFPMKPHAGRFALDSAYVADITRVAPGTVHRWSQKQDVRDYAARNGDVVKIDLALSFEASKIIDKDIPLHEVSSLVNLLRTACFIVIAYLTGMRPGEVLAMEVGTLKPSSHDGGWMLIQSRHFKPVRDENGNHDSRGAQREAPWVAVESVVRAIRAVEGIGQGDGLLFPSAWVTKNKGRSMSYTAATDNVLGFMEHINIRNPEAIPEDPIGRVTSSRFRRTLAWHIANQPRGLIALAVQYGHLRTAVSEGYASRTKDGIQDLVDFETARSIALSLSQAYEDMESGEGISGPSALRFVSSLREQADQFNGVVTNQRQAKSLLRNQRLTVYQNDDAFVWCNFRRDSALCLAGDDPKFSITPRLDKCKPNCGNVVRTDRQAAMMKETAERLRDQSNVMPRPSAERLTAHADDLLARAERHGDERTTLEDYDAPH